MITYIEHSNFRFFQFHLYPIMNQRRFRHGDIMPMGNRSNVGVPRKEALA